MSSSPTGCMIMYKHQAKGSVVNAWKPKGVGRLGKENIVKDVIDYDYGESLKKEPAECEIADCELALVEAEHLEVPERDKIMTTLIMDEERINKTKKNLQDDNPISDPYSIFTSDELCNNFNQITYFGIDDTEEKKVSNGTTDMPKPWPFNQSHNQKVEKESNTCKVPQQNSSNKSKENIPTLVANDALFQQNRPANDWDLIKAPPTPKTKNPDKFIKRKWFAGDKVAVWYKNEFYVGKVVLVIPNDLSVQLHLPDWDYEKNKEVKTTVSRYQDEIYRLGTFDLEGREETKYIRWQEGDICWAWYTNENEYYTAFFQKFDETNPYYCHVVFEGFEDDGLYMCACNFVIPNYMWNAEYIKYDLKNDKDLLLDQDKTKVRKDAALLRRARNARKNRGENKEIYLQPLEEERPWGENGVVGMTAQPTTLKKKKKFKPAPPPSAAGPSSSTRHQHTLPVYVPKTFKFIQRKKPVEEEFEETDDSEQSDVEDDGFTMFGIPAGFQDPSLVISPQAYGSCPPYVPPEAYGSCPPYVPPEAYGSCPPYVPPEAYGSYPPYVPPEAYGSYPPYVPPEAYGSCSEEPPAAEYVDGLDQSLENITEPFSSLTVETIESSPSGMTEVPRNVESLANAWKKQYTTTEQTQII